MFLKIKILNKKFILSYSLTLIFFILISYLCFWGIYESGADLDDKILRHLSSNLLSTNRIDIIDFFEKITQTFNITDAQYDRFIF